MFAHDDDVDWRFYGRGNVDGDDELNALDEMFAHDDDIDWGFWTMK